MPKTHYTRFLVTSSWTGNCQFVTDLLRTCERHGQQVCNNSATIKKVVVIKFGKRHDTTDTIRTFARTNLLRTSYGLSTLETVVADVAENGDCCRIRQQSPVLATVAELGDYSRQCGQAITDLSFMLRTCCKLVVDLLSCYAYGETGVVDFGFYSTEAI